MKNRGLLIIQLVGTLGILAWVPTNIGKTICFLLLWVFTFRKLTRPEVFLFLGAWGFFSFMNFMAVRQGVFTFAHPNFMGMPWYELFMWGFYLTHTIRMIGGPPPQRFRKTSWVLAILFALPFSLISDQTLLLVSTSAFLGISIIVFHEKYDFYYMGYLILVGAAIEYIGVSKGDWYYPDPPPGGVPFWFIPMWGGIGLFLRRLVLPLLKRDRV